MLLSKKKAKIEEKYGEALRFLLTRQMKRLLSM